jgi:cbb3-type cytochrome oxidase subunit 3
MIGELLQELIGGGAFGTIVMVVLMVSFAAIVYWTIRIDKKHVERMGHLPLESDQEMPGSGVKHG